jgi:hypothetical protein
MEQYRFRIRKGSDFDLQRIIKENDEPDVLIIESPRNIIGLVHSRFLSKFRKEDEIKVGSLVFYYMWAFHCPISLRMTDRGQFSVDRDDIDSSYRCMEISTYGKDAFIKEIEIAREFLKKKKIEVKVTAFGNKKEKKPLTEAEEYYRRFGYSSYNEVADRHKDPICKLCGDSFWRHTEYECPVS